MGRKLGWFSVVLAGKLNDRRKGKIASAAPVRPSKIMKNTTTLRDGESKAMAIGNMGLAAAAVYHVPMYGGIKDCKPVVSRPKIKGNLLISGTKIRNVN
jgi:hypothetical protein